MAVIKAVEIWSDGRMVYDYDRRCVAEDCLRLVSMPINGNLCTSCATKARKGITITLKKGKKL